MPFVSPHACCVHHFLYRSIIDSRYTCPFFLGQFDAGAIRVPVKNQIVDALPDSLVFLLLPVI